ncbi:MAG TPA: response regulator transcription factor [Bryobacteraceae bacterium]|nr:response regulator transcription factor [Bryobacteraceae bacterium]
MGSEGPVVVVVDDDVSVREALRNLLRSVGLQVKTFDTARQFLADGRPEAPGCLILDVRLPGLSGLDLQRELANAQIDIPIIFITGHGDIPMSVRAMKAGAVEFLTKPFRDQDLLDAVQEAIARDREARAQWRQTQELRTRYDSLTAREREVLVLVVRGLMNKQIAGQLGTTEATVKLHRGRVMHKMQANSLADLIRMAEKLDLPTVKSARV